MIQSFNIICATLNNHHQYRMAVGFLNISFKYQLTFFSARLRLSAGRTGPAKAMVNNSGLSKIKMNMKRETIYRVMDI